MSTSRSSFQAVIYVLGLALLLCVGGAIALAILGDPLPDLLKEVAVGCLSGLGGMLIHPPSSSDDVQAVVVQQPAGQPVPVDTDPGVPEQPRGGDLG